VVSAQLRCAPTTGYTLRCLRHPKVVIQAIAGHMELSEKPKRTALKAPGEGRRDGGFAVELILARRVYLRIGAQLGFDLWEKDVSPLQVGASTSAKQLPVRMRTPLHSIARRTCPACPATITERSGQIDPKRKPRRTYGGLSDSSKMPALPARRTCAQTASFLVRRIARSAEAGGGERDAAKRGESGANCG
jgi:hypothetical protein